MRRRSVLTEEWAKGVSLRKVGMGRTTSFQIRSKATPAAEPETPGPITETVVVKREGRSRESRKASRSRER